jgi:hypothetical protein
MLDILDDVFSLIHQIFLFVFSWKVLALVMVCAGLAVAMDVLKNRKNQKQDKEGARLERRAAFSPQGRVDYAAHLRSQDPQAFKRYVSECAQKQALGYLTMTSWLKMDSGSDLRQAWKYAKLAAAAHEPESEKQLNVLKEKIKTKLDKIAQSQQARNALLLQAEPLYASKQWKALKELVSDKAAASLESLGELHYWSKEIGWFPDADYERWFNICGTALVWGTDWNDRLTPSSQAKTADLCFAWSKTDGTFENEYARLLVQCVYMTENRFKKLDEADAGALVRQGRRCNAPCCRQMDKVLAAWSFDDGMDLEVRPKEEKIVSGKRVGLDDNAQRDLDWMLGGDGSTLEEKLISGQMSYADYLDWEELNTKSA